MAAAYGHKDIVEALLKAGADINISNNVSGGYRRGRGRGTRGTKERCR